MVKSSNIDKIQSVICPDKVKMPLNYSDEGNFD